MLTIQQGAAILQAVNYRGFVESAHFAFISTNKSHLNVLLDLEPSFRPSTAAMTAS